MNPKSRHMLTGAGIGLAVTVPTVLLALHSTGAGHGSYWAVDLFFPYVAVLKVVLDAGPLLMSVAAILQFPFYGAALGAAYGSRHRLRLAILLLGVPHLVAATWILIARHA